MSLPRCVAGGAVRDGKDGLLLQWGLLSMSNCEPAQLKKLYKDGCHFMATLGGCQSALTLVPRACNAETRCEENRVHQEK